MTLYCLLHPPPNSTYKKCLHQSAYGKRIIWIINSVYAFLNKKSLGFQATGSAQAYTHHILAGCMHSFAHANVSLLMGILRVGVYTYTI